MQMMLYLFELVAAAIVLLTLPLVIELTLLTVASLLPKRPPNRALGPDSCRLAAIVPAHNEELLIANCVESLKASAEGHNTRIVVVAHNCSDDTAARAAGAGAEVLVHNDPLNKGKGAALSAGFAYTNAKDIDATLVVDADSTVSANLIGAVRQALSDGAEAVQCRYEMDSSSKRPSTRLAALAFRGFNVVRPTGRARLGISAGIVGNGFAVRQEILKEDCYNSHSVVEDLEFHLRLVLAGKRVHFLEDAKVSSALPTSKHGEETQRSRWEGGRANVARTWLFPLFRQVLRGRLRLLEPILEVTCLPIGYAVFLLLVCLCFPLLWTRLYGLATLTVISWHVLTAASSGPDFSGDIRILARAPGYILWKLCMFPALLRSSRRNAVWVRTERDPTKTTGDANLGMETPAAAVAADAVNERLLETL